MATPTTTGSTPPASGRIGQPTATSAVVLQAYKDSAFPGVAFTNQLAIDLTSNTLVFYDSNGAWQGLSGSAGVQSFYGPVAPVTGVEEGDRWFDTTTGVWNMWNKAKGKWLPGNIAYSATAPTNPQPGDAWFNTGTNILSFWNGTAWVPSDDFSAPGVFIGAMPTAAVVGSKWTDSNGVQYVCITTYASGGTMADWQQIVLATDPLATLIGQNGQLVVAQEATPPPTPTPSTAVTAATGLVWLDITDGSSAEGNYYVYTGSAWQLVTSPSTLVLCAGLKVSQTAPGILGTNLNYIWPDPLAVKITLNSAFAIGSDSNVSTNPGPWISSPISWISVTSNMATVGLANGTAGFMPQRSISIAGLTHTALNGTWTVSEVLDAQRLTFAATTADIAEVADTGEATFILKIGDVAEDPGLNEWFIYNSDSTTGGTGTWADWVLVTNPSTIALCATIGTRAAPNMISQRCILVGTDVSTGNPQNIAADLNGALADVMALADASFQNSDVALSNYAVASGSWVAPSMLYFSGPDQPLLTQVGWMGLDLLDTYSAQDIQALASVTDEGWTGTAYKISNSNFLSTYETNRGVL